MTATSPTLTLELQEAGFSVEAHLTGMYASSCKNADLLRLPADLSGAEIARRIRQTGDTPIIILTAADDLNTKVEMLNAGATIIWQVPHRGADRPRRCAVAQAQRPGRPRDGNLSIDAAPPGAVGDTEVRLTVEFDLLTYLSSQPGRVYSRQRSS